MSGAFEKQQRRVPPSAVRLGLPALALAALSAYALLVLQPLAAENKAMRAQLAGLAALSARVSELGELLAASRRDADEEASSYQDILRDLRGWRVEAHTHVGRLATQAGLEVAAMEWTEAEPVTPEFETDKRRRWLRTSVSIRLVGAWQAHRNFAHSLSRCDCLVQVVEEKVTAFGRLGSVEVAVFLFIYHPGESARV